MPRRTLLKNPVGWKKQGFLQWNTTNNEHAAVLASIRGVRGRVTSGETEIARRLAHELAAWFPAHADYLDSALAQWMVKHQFGGAPIVLRRAVVRGTS